jgi:hypothetical protein
MFSGETGLRCRLALEPSWSFILLLIVMSSFFWLPPTMGWYRFLLLFYTKGKRKLKYSESYRTVNSIATTIIIIERNKTGYKTQTWEYKIVGVNEIFIILSKRKPQNKNPTNSQDFVMWTWIQLNFQKKTNREPLRKTKTQGSLNFKFISNECTLYYTSCYNAKHKKSHGQT